MIIGILKELGGDNRVSLLPDQTDFFIKKGFTIFVEKNAGINAFVDDEEYKTKGCIIHSRTDILKQSDILLSISTLAPADIYPLKPDVILLGVYSPLFQYKLMKGWADKGLTTFSMDIIPRTTRAQSMDVLSSQANIAGYKAVLLAANTYPKYFPMFMTAAGSIAPAKVLILGAGVAGLQAIATAKRLGAVIEVFDTRPAVKEEVMSLGAKFVEVEGAADASTAGGYAVQQTSEYQEKQKARIAEAVKKADVIITTAQIPGKNAPLLITPEMLLDMKSGSVIIDLASSTGGNTSVTKDNETIIFNGVTVIGNSNLASSLPADASKLYGKNISNFLSLMIDKENQFNLNFNDDLVAGTCITHKGKIYNSKIQELLKH